MDELTAAAAVMAMAVDDFDEEEFEQYSPHVGLLRSPSMKHNKLLQRPWRPTRKIKEAILRPAHPGLPTRRCQ